MRSAAHIFIWVSLLFFLAGFAAKSNACAFAKQIQAHSQHLHLSQTQTSHQLHVSSQADNICTQDADDVDSDDHNDDVLIPAALHYVAVVFLQPHIRAKKLSVLSERAAFSPGVPRYILFHSLVIPPTVGL